MNLIFVGPQGSGKGTQAKLVAEKFGLFYLESGALMREKAKENSVRGRKIDEIINVQGKLLPDEMTFSLLKGKLDLVDIKKGVVFDGYPRGIAQFKTLERYLQGKAEKIDKVFFLTLGREGSIRRLSNRRVCEKCGENFNLITRRPKLSGICDSCGGKLIQRSDDTPQRIRVRLRQYQEQTAPLILLWRKRGILEEVDGERPIEVIFEDILKRLKPMIPLKTEKEINLMREGGRRLRQVLARALAEVRPGASELAIDNLIEAEIKKKGGKPSFKMVPGYHWASCLTVNEEVVHGIPGKRVLMEGDVVGLDLGMYFRGFHTDLATTVEVGRKKVERREKFLEVGRSALEAAIQKTQVDNFIGDLSLVIEKKIRQAGYTSVKALTGHGIGRALHEEPAIPCFLKGMVEKTPQLKPGMTLAIEVIYNQGSEKIVLGEDGWTISTFDGKISGLFEETVAVTEDGPLVLTR